MYKKKNGFSMIELLVVTTIMIVLTTIALVSYRAATQNARNSKRKADLETVRQALVLYRSDEGNYPITDNFTTMLSTITNYISAQNIADPKNVSPYLYEYSSDGSTFTLTAYLEADAQVYSLANP